MKLILFLLFLFAFICILQAKYYSAIKSGDGNFYIQEGQSSQALAEAKFEPDMKKTGWNNLHIMTNSHMNVSDLDLAFAAGYLEGSLDTERTWDTYLANAKATGEVADFLKKNIDWTLKMVDTKPTGEEEYWTHVGLIMRQLEGVHRGYNDHADASKQLDFLDFFAINCAGDLETIFNHFAKEESDEPVISIKRFQDHIFGSHCSALIKLPSDRKELFTAHTTWSTFESMIRAYKIYQLDFNNVQSSTVSFSSYPATLSSIDDFYVTANGLSVIETTNGIYNKTLLAEIKPEAVLSWIRIIVANRMATSGYWWVDVFKKYNSGTYNNQWIITDFNMFQEGINPLKNGTLWIAEQIPGYVESADMTWFLNQHGYWPSYNIPYFKYIFDISGFPAYVEKYGSWFSHSGSPRAKIFAREEGRVNCMDDMKWIMRFNNWQTDPFSEGNAGNAISSRFDLVTKNYTNPYLNKNAFGGIDSKVTSNKFYNDGMLVYAQSGPTYNQQARFDWNKWPNIAHVGQPELYTFDWHLFAPTH